MRSVPYSVGLLLLLLMVASPSQAEIISSETLIYVGKETLGIKPLGVVKLNTKSADGVHITGISALAWDEDEGVLYAVTDKGLVHHL